MYCVVINIKNVHLKQNIVKGVTQKRNFTAIDFRANIQGLELDKMGNPPPYGWGNGTRMQPPPAAPPSYSQAVGGVGPSSPYTPQYPATAGPPIVTTVVPVGSQPTHMICPSCQAEINSETQTKPGIIAYISGAIIALGGCFCGCCLIPCCIDSCMDVHHRCPNCGAYLGRYRR